MDKKGQLPVPKITEGFIDKVIELAGGRRLTDAEKNFEQSNNADYLLDGAVVELKIIEEEGLEKKERQNKVAALLKEKFVLPAEVDIDLKTVPDVIRQEYTEILGGPIKTHVKKAAKQIKLTKAHLGRVLDFGILIIVNNGYGSLTYDEFENLVLRYARKETSQIDFIICITASFHAGDFDSYVFCVSHCHPVTAGLQYPKSDEVIKFVDEQFNEAMAEMMRGKALADPLSPVKEIVFDREGVRFVRHAPTVSDSRFKSRKNA
jgi:hypothetical protein